MPTIIIYGPKLAVDKKRELVAKLTDIASQIYSMDKRTITILIHEQQAENVGVGGELIADKEKQN
ncbi:MAG: 2-hydroxymuconate tautomerase family protein [Archaeoglobales archaeon]|nr:2-hydroxymuconate tautomerase family protein [Archaeoglobales archaeon]